jgi:hypothetical protein
MLLADGKFFEKGQAMPPKAFGSGNFGEWIEDEHGLPAYRYTCDQTHDPKAVAPTNPIWRAPTDHSHQVGNDRLVAVASNYGYIQVRQDEGGPKFLNDYDPHHNHHAGGFGYLIDGQTVLGTFYPGGADSFERIFGIGYLRKTVRKNGYSADQVIFAPFGDDPILVSQVTITNQTNAAANLRWIEYWGCQQYQFSHRAQVLATISRGKRHTAELQREFSTRFAHHFRVLDDRSGLVNEKVLQGYTSSDRSTGKAPGTMFAGAAAGLPGKVLTGGIDATTFIEPDLHRVEAKISALIEGIKPHPGVLLGSADTAPRGTPLETLRLIQHLVSTAGSYLDRAAGSYRPGEFLTSIAGADKTPESRGTTPVGKEAVDSVDMHQVLQELTRRLYGKRPEVTGIIKFIVSGDQAYRLFMSKGSAVWKSRTVQRMQAWLAIRRTCWHCSPAGSTPWPPS